MHRFCVCSLITSLVIYHSNIGVQLRRVTTCGYSQWSLFLIGFSQLSFVFPSPISTLWCLLCFIDRANRLPKFSHGCCGRSCQPFHFLEESCTYQCKCLWILGQTWHCRKCLFIIESFVCCMYYSSKTKFTRWPAKCRKEEARPLRGTLPKLLMHSLGVWTKWLPKWTQQVQDCKALAGWSVSHPTYFFPSEVLTI